MKRKPGELISPLDIGKSGAIELPNRTYDRVGLKGLATSVTTFNPHFPGVSFTIELGPFNRSVKANIRANAKLISTLVEVVQKNFLRRIILRPILGLKRVGVYMVGVINTAARIAVLKP